MNASEDLEQYKKNQKTLVEQFSSNGPSVLRNSVAMWFVQLFAIIAICFVSGFALVQEFQDVIGIENKPVFYALIAVVIVLLLVIRKLARMVRRRNKHIIQIEELIRNPAEK